MKKDILGVSLFLVLFTLALFLFYNGQTKEKLVVKTPDLIKKTYYISGKILDASMNLVTIKTKNGSIYDFSLVNVDPKNITELIIDSEVKVTYYGVLETGLSVQKGEVKEIISIKKKDTDTYPDTWNDNGIFSDNYNKAYTKLKTMTLDEKIGQLLLVRVPEVSQIETLKNYNLGGYILFGRDTYNKTKEQLVSTIKSYQSSSKIPLIIATDEEGGIVNRISTNKNLSDSPFLSSQDLYDKGGYELIKKDTIKKSNLLLELGINMNLAPVADVSTNPDDYIYSRTFGQNADATAEYIKTVITASNDFNVTYTMKHFPGYGNNKDTHTGYAIDKRDYETFVNSDFLPFLSGIKNGAKSILVSHNIVESMDKEKPASLSKNVHNILREQLGFTGLIMTDDLAMDAISKFVVSSASVDAILSGNDMLIVTDFKKAINDIKMGLNQDIITEEMIDHLVFRILAYKYSSGLL